MKEGFLLYRDIGREANFMGLLEKLNNEARNYVFNVLEINPEKYTDNDIIYALISKVLSSNSKLAVIPLQDYLCLGSQARINTPSTPEGNWTWRVKKERLTHELTADSKEQQNITLILFPVWQTDFAKNTDIDL